MNDIELLEEIDCPYCEKEISYLKGEEGTIKYRDKSFEIIYYFYKCNICKQEFTTTESDNKTLNQIPNYGRD